MQHKLAMHHVSFLRQYMQYASVRRNARKLQSTIIDLDHFVFRRHCPYRMGFHIQETFYDWIIDGRNILFQVLTEEPYNQPSSFLGNTVEMNNTISLKVKKSLTQ